jgi:MoaA/NifB/PqqE/SkfB family radical SAM enzyme
MGYYQKAKEGAQQIKEGAQRTVIKKILSATSDLSDKNIAYILDLVNKYLVKDKSLNMGIENIKKVFQEGGKKDDAYTNMLELIKNNLGRLSPNCKAKFIENFLVNAVILGTQKKRRLSAQLGFGLPWFFVISPSARCNLSCVGCYAWEYTKDDGLSFEEVDRIFIEAKEIGTYFVTITGGEPFFWPHLFKIFEKHNDMYFQIYTNGTLITKEVAEKLAKAGNAAPAISIEGFEKETDQRRGKGTFKKIMQAMDNLKEAGVVFGFSATPTKINSEIISSDKFIDLMIEKGCSFGWLFQYVPIGKSPDVSLMSSPEQRNELRDRVNEIRKSKPIFIGDFWNDGPHVRGCLAGARPGGYFHINSNGDVEPCVFLQFSVDNIKGKKLIDVIQSPFFKAIQKEQPYCTNKNLLTPCALIDNPEILRKIVKEHKAKPSYEGGEKTINNEKITKFLDNYSKEFKKLTDPVWEKELSKKYKTWKDHAEEIKKDL